MRIWQLLVIVQSAGDGGLEYTGEASGVGGSNPAAVPPPPPPISYPLDELGRVRTRGDLAALINAGADSVTIKTEICGNGDERMDDEEENEVVCIVGLDESNRIISLEDPFQTDETSGGEEESYRTDDEELLDESVDNGEEREYAGSEARAPDPDAEVDQQEGEQDRD